jgi:hypothetical protein
MLEELGYAEIGDASNAHRAHIALHGEADLTLDVWYKIIKENKRLNQAFSGDSQ